MFFLKSEGHYFYESSPLDPRFAGSDSARLDGFFSERKNPEYGFFRKGSKAVGPVPLIYGT